MKIFLIWIHNFEVFTSKKVKDFIVLHAANEKLTNVEAIKLTDLYTYAFEFYGNEYGTVHFKNVRQFNITLDEDLHLNSYLPLEFDQLEGIMIESSWAIGERWIEFIGTSYELNTLSLLKSRKHGRYEISSHK